MRNRGQENKVMTPSEVVLVMAKRAGTFAPYFYLK